MVVSTPSSALQRNTASGLAAGWPEHALLNSHLAVAMDLVTEPWCNSILRAAFLGVRRLDAFQHVLRAPRQTLSLRLSYLVDIGLLRRQPMGDSALRHSRWRGCGQSCRPRTHPRRTNGHAAAAGAGPLRSRSRRRSVTSWP